jgi:hypothetical protein
MPVIEIPFFGYFCPLGGLLRLFLRREITIKARAFFFPRGLLGTTIKFPRQAPQPNYPNGCVSLFLLQECKSSRCVVRMCNVYCGEFFRTCGLYLGVRLQAQNLAWIAKNTAIEVPLLAPYTSGPRDVPRCGALSLLQKTLHNRGDPAETAAGLNAQFSPD